MVKYRIVDWGKAIKHVKRHCPWSRVIGKSRFNFVAWRNVRNIVRIVLREENLAKRRGGRLVFERRFGRSVGWSRTHKEIHSVRVVGQIVNWVGEEVGLTLVTAYPMAV